MQIGDVTRGGPAIVYSANLARFCVMPSMANAAIGEIVRAGRAAATPPFEPVPPAEPKESFA